MEDVKMLRRIVKIHGIAIFFNEKDSTRIRWNMRAEFDKTIHHETMEMRTINN